eukprot:3654159-Prymnesium_polylepis.1
MGDVLERVAGQCILFTKFPDLDKWFTSDEDLRRVLGRVERVARRVRGRVRPPACPDARFAAAHARPPPAAARLYHVRHRDQPAHGPAL